MTTESEGEMPINPDQPDEKSLFRSKEEVAGLAEAFYNACKGEDAAGTWAAAPLYELLLEIEMVTPEWNDKILKAREDQLIAQGDSIVGPPYPPDPRV